MVAPVQSDFERPMLRYKSFFFAFVLFRDLLITKSKLLRYVPYTIKPILRGHPQAGSHLDELKCPFLKTFYSPDPGFKTPDTLRNARTSSNELSS